MATEGGEERTGVPVPVVAGGSGFIGSAAQRYYNHGLDFLVALFACFHGLVSTIVLLAILVVMMNNGDAYHHICQDDGCPLVVRPVVSMGVEGLAAILALCFTGWRRELSKFSLLMVILTAKVSARLLYVALSGSYCPFGGDIVKVAATVAAVVVGQLVLSFLGARFMIVRLADACRAAGQEQLKRGSTSVHGV